MTWLQYRGADLKLSERLGMQIIPRDLAIDSGGVLMGLGFDVKGTLKKLIKRANEAKPAMPQVAAAKPMGQQPRWGR